MRYEARAKQNYDRLVEMGARPTRPLRLRPTWTATYKDNLFYIYDNEGELECTLSDDIDPMCHHWLEESRHFRSELGKWQKFRGCQQRFQHLDRLETQLELDNTDARVINALTKLSDWQEFEVFQHHILTDALNFEDQCRCNLLYITKCEDTTEELLPSSAAHHAIGPWLRPFGQSQEDIEAARKQLDWVKDQWPKVVAEAIESISMASELLPLLEAKFRKQTNGAFNAIQRLGGRPSHGVSPPDKGMDGLHRLLYWSSESSKYMEELLDWETFLDWRRRKLGGNKPVEGGEYQCPQFRSASESFAEFENFRLYQYDLALTRLRCRQRIVRWYEEEIETPRWYIDEMETNCSNIAPEFLHDYSQAARSHVRDSEQKLADAAMRLEKSKQEHARALSVHRESIGGETVMQYPHKPFLSSLPILDKDSLKSSQSSFSSSSQISIRPTSPQASHSSQPLQSLQSPQPSQSPQSTYSPQSSHSSQFSKRISKDRRGLCKGSTVEKLHRRLRKDNARKKKATISDINIEQQALPAFSLDPHDVKEDVDTQMTDAPKLWTSAEAIDESWEVESGDIVMTDSEGSLNHIFSDASLHHPRPVTNTHSKKLPSPAQGPTSRKTRSTTKLDQASTSKVFKNKNKKPAKKAKAYTEQQAMMLLNAASNQVSTTNGSPLRRSERLKEKAAVSAAIAAPQLNVARLSSPLQQERPRKKPGAVRDSKSSRQKTADIQSNALEPLPKLKRPRQKKCTIQAETLESPHT